MQDIQGGPSGAARGTPDGRGHGWLWAGAILIGLGALLLAGSAGMLAWWSWTVMWPVLVIALGVLLLARRLS